LVEQLLSLVEWLQANPALSAPLFVVVFCLIMAVGIPGGWFLLLSAGFLFGTFGGATLVILGVFLAAGLTYVGIRTAFGRWLDHRAEAWQGKVREFIDQGNTLLLVMPRMIPVFPFFALNVSMTAAGVPLSTYLWTTTVGTVPIAIVICSIGAQFKNLEEVAQAGLVDTLLSPGLLWPIGILLSMTFAGWAYLRKASAGRRTMESG
jgi:uncharacterized membrane protein YdjX (TVP38/TMEM64 family)